MEFLKYLFIDEDLWNLAPKSTVQINFRLFTRNEKF